MSVDVIKLADFIVNVQNDSAPAPVPLHIFQLFCESFMVPLPDTLLQHFCFVLRVIQGKPLGIYSFEISCLLSENKWRDGVQG